MKQLLMFILVAIPFFCNCQNLKALDTKNGFRDMQFGDSDSKFNDLVVDAYSSDSLSIFCRRTGDKLTIGASEVSIIYVFYKSQLKNVVIKTKGLKNSRALLDALQEMYGKGRQPNEYIEEYYWWGKKVTLDYDENSISGDAKVFITSKEISGKQDLDSKEKAKEAKNDF